ncbi:MAG: hypothetical protein ACREML_14335 [Vulcanimicrobiaceae bacterium]
MGAHDIELSRISKLFLDRDETSADVALARRREFTLTLLCGGDVARSYVLQLAALTAAALASRCFPDAVRVACPRTLLEAPLLVWPSLKLTFGQALADLSGATASADEKELAHGLVFGNAPAPDGALRVTFDGWIAKVGPMRDVPRLPERQYCSLAGTLAASIAVSELFLSFAEINIEATRRIVGLSLWRPNLNIGDPAALGLPVEYLPQKLWVLGLGHLGNAYLWSLATLPYGNASPVEFFLNDFDEVEPENVETGILFTPGRRGLKSRVCADWLERRGFGTRLIERRFDGSFRRQRREPGLALCGFDSNPARRDLGAAQFLRVVESGLGGTASNFDAISLHTLPNPRMTDELWPDLSEEEEAKRVEHQQRVARDNPAYKSIREEECGRYDLAGKSVAVPFVGMAAASLVVAELLRLPSDGAAYTDIKLRLESPTKLFTQTTGNYGVKDLEGLAFCDAVSLSCDGAPIS